MLIRSKWHFKVVLGYNAILLLSCHFVWPLVATWKFNYCIITYIGTVDIIKTISGARKWNPDCPLSRSHNHRSEEMRYNGSQNLHELPHVVPGHSRRAAFFQSPVELETRLSVVSRPDAAHVQRRNLLRKNARLFWPAIYSRTHVGARERKGYQVCSRPVRSGEEELFSLSSHVHRSSRRTGRSWRCSARIRIFEWWVLNW